jgi:hypothetical protein
MRRILLLVTVASMLAAALALSGVAQAKPTATSADRQCKKLAIQTLPNFKPAHYTFHGGTEDPDIFDDDNTEGQPDVFCGFGGADSIETTLDAGDIFLGGTESDAVLINNGTFYGQEVGDIVGTNNGTFYGGAGDDFVIDNFGTYYGQEGSDGVDNNHPGATFDGGDGDDRVVVINDGGCLISVEIPRGASVCPNP